MYLKFQNFFGGPTDDLPLRMLTVGKRERKIPQKFVDEFEAAPKKSRSTQKGKQKKSSKSAPAKGKQNGHNNISDHSLHEKMKERMRKATKIFSTWNLELQLMYMTNSL